MDLQLSLDRKTKKFESTISVSEGKRAIYIDFEGFEDHPPSFIGVLVDGNFEQIILDERLSLAAQAKGLAVKSGTGVIGSLLKKATDEGRRIVAYSQHEKQVCLKHYGIDLSPVYADARFIAKKWRTRALSMIEPKPRSLKDYLTIIGYERGAYLGDKQSTQRIRAVQEMLLKKGNYADLTATVKAKWSKVLEHNSIDVMGMEALVKHTLQN